MLRQTASSAFALVVLLACLSTPAAAFEALTPTAKWVVHYDEAQCAASRNYGTEANSLHLVFKIPALGDVVQLSVIHSSSYPPRDAEEVVARVKFDASPPLRTTAITFGPSKGKTRVFRINLSREKFEIIRNSKTLSIEAGGGLDAVFALSDTPPLLSVMEDCLADLRKVWNVADRGVLHPQLREAASGTLQGVFRAEDYPGVAIDKSASGSVQFVVLIDEAGKVADCTVTQTSGVASLDAQSCAVITERARFKPAIGIDGKPARGSLVQKVNWRLQ